MRITDLHIFTGAVRNLRDKYLRLQCGSVVMPDYTLSFKGLKESQGTIAVPLLVDKLELIQNLTYVVGEYTEKRPFKIANVGARRKSTLNQYTLIFKDLRKGSTEVVFFPMSSQTSLDVDTPQFMPMTKGVASLSIVHDLIGHIESDDNPSEYLSKTITDPKYRNRIGRLLLELYPKEEDEYSIFFINDASVSFRLDGKLRPQAKKMIDDNYSEEKDTLDCPILSNIFETNHSGMKSFMTSIGGKKRIIPVTPEIFEQVIESSGHVVEIECNYKVNFNGDIIDIYDVTNITKKDKIELWDISYKSRNYNLVKPLVIKIESNIEKKNDWFLKNEDLGIMSVSEDWDDAIVAFNEEFDVFVQEYVLTKDKLSPSAIKLRDKILGYLGW